MRTINMNLDIDLAGLEFFGTSVILAFTGVLLVIASILISFITARRNNKTKENNKPFPLIWGGAIIILSGIIGIAILFLMESLELISNDRAFRRFLDDYDIHYAFITACIAILTIYWIHRKKRKVGIRQDSA